MKKIAFLFLLTTLPNCIICQEDPFRKHSFKANFYFGGNFQLSTKQPTPTFVTEINALNTKLGGLKVEYNKIIANKGGSYLYMGLAYMALLGNNLNIVKSNVGNYSYKIQTNNFLVPFTFRYLFNQHSNQKIYIEASTAPSFSLKNSFSKKANEINANGTWNEGEFVGVKEANLRPFNNLICLGLGLSLSSKKFKNFGLEISPTYSFQSASFLRNNVSGRFKSVGINFGITF